MVQVSLLLINITFLDGQTPDGGFYMTAIPRVGEHIRIATGQSYEQECLVRVTEVEYFAARQEKVFSAYGKTCALIKVEAVDE